MYGIDITMAFNYNIATMVKPVIQRSNGFIFTTAQYIENIMPSTDFLNVTTGYNQSEEPDCIHRQ